MRKIILPLSFLLVCYMTQAQQTGAHTEFSINGGVASPTGSFSKGDYADPASGFAKTGSHFNITATYFLTRHFGIGALVGYSRFGYTGAQSLADGYKEDSGTDSTTLYTSGKNSNLSVLIGPYYRFHLGKNFSIDVRAMGGYVQTRLAGFSVFYEDYTDNKMTQDKSSGNGFGYQAGAGLNYSIHSHWGVKLNADYFSSKPKADITYDNFVVNSGRKLTTYHEPVSGINVTAGLSYTF